jgi:MYXO-CTERM domain-containing protein
MLRLICHIRLVVLSGLLIAALAIPSHARAQGGCITGSAGCSSAPEIDPSLIGEGGALLAGIVLLLRARRKS